MTRPLHGGIDLHDGGERGGGDGGGGKRGQGRPSGGHAGLWFDKFCDRWRVEGRPGSTQWSMKGEKGNREDREDNPKLAWINTLADGPVGAKDQIDEHVLRLVQLVEGRGGRLGVFTAGARFVTGLGRSHPVENGFAFHPTLAAPYVPGSSVKGLVRAWATLDAEPAPMRETVERIFGAQESAGCVSFLDAVPVRPVRLEADVMTPHYANWDKDHPPGDWRSPTPIPFLVAAKGTSFLFGIAPLRTAANGDLEAVMDAVMSWLSSALEWAGGGAKTAVGYGRFERDEGETGELRQRLRQKQEAAAQRARRAAMSPIDREIEDCLKNRADRNMPEITAIMAEVEKGRWSGDDKVTAARWLEARMKMAKRWREASKKKNPAKDREYQDTLRVMGWLRGE